MKEEKGELSEEMRVAHVRREEMGSQPALTAPEYPLSAQPRLREGQSDAQSGR